MVALLLWASENPELFGILASAIFGPLIMLIASRLLATKQPDATPIPVAAPTSDVREALAEISASARMNYRVLEELAIAVRALARDAEDIHGTIDDNRRTLAQHSNALDRIEDMQRHLSSDGSHIPPRRN